jgi:transposase-like protein
MRPIKDFCCQNPECPDYGIRDKGNLRLHDFSGKDNRIRIFFCKTCQRHFSERKGTVLEEAKLPEEMVTAILQHIQEGCGTRAISRLLNVSTNTVTRYIRLAGIHAKDAHDELVAFSPSDKRGPIG